MSNELITIIVSIGGLILTSTIAIVGLILVQSRAMRRDMGQMEARLREDTAHLRQDMKELRGEVSDLRDRMGRIEGTLDVLRQFFIRNGRGTAA